MFFFSYVFLHFLRSHELISFPVSFQLRPFHRSKFGPPSSFGLMPANRTFGQKWTAERCGLARRAYLQQLRNSDSQNIQELQAKKRPRHGQMLLGEVKAMLIFRY